MSISANKLNLHYLTKSRFKEAIECPDKLFYAGKRHEYADGRDDNEFLRELAKGGIQVGELAKSYFPEGIEIDTLDIAMALQQTNELLQRKTVTIFEAAVAYNGLLVRIDVLEKKGKTLNLYEVKSKSYSNEDEIFTKRNRTIKADWRPYVYDIAFQVYVTRKAFPNNVTHGSLFLINKNSRTTVDDLFQKFLVRKVNGRYKVITNGTIETGERILGKVDLGNCIDDILQGTETLNGHIHSFENYVHILATSFQAQTKLNTPISKECKSCQYKTSEEDEEKGLKSGFDECWIAKANLQLADLAKPHIFEIWNFRKIEEYLLQGKYFITDLSKDDFIVEKTTSKRLVPPHERQWMQVERAQNPNIGSYFDKSGFSFATQKLQYPIHFIDFECTRNAIPYLKGFNPYSQIAFQFSRHSVDSSGKVTHGEWIETRRATYPNFDFIRNLKKQINQDSGSILIYSSFENSVLLGIYDFLNSSSEPDRTELMTFIKEVTWSDGTRGTWSGTRKMIDMKDWVMDFYISPDMKGSNSIKVVLPAIINDSKYLRKKYSELIKRNAEGQLINPYKLLPPILDHVERLTIESLMEENEIADGGAAMCAFSLMQFAEMKEEERNKIIQALLQYCKLDTLAMVMLFEGLSNFGN